MNARWLLALVAAAIPLPVAAVVVYLPTAQVGHRVTMQPVIALNGERVSLARTDGRWTYLTFFASWCGPCNLEMPTVERDARRYQRSLRVIGIDERESPSLARAFAAKYALSFPVYIDPPVTGLAPSDWRAQVYGPHGAFGAMEEQWSANMLPGSVLIDPHGIVRAVWDGWSGSDELTAHLRHFSVGTGG